MKTKNPDKALRDFEKQHDILGTATLREPFITDTDLARSLLDEVRGLLRGLREPCYVQKVKAIGGSPVVLFSRHPLYPETIAEWRKLDRARDLRTCSREDRVLRNANPQTVTPKTSGAARLARVFDHGGDTCHSASNTKRTMVPPKP